MPKPSAYARIITSLCSKEKVAEHVLKKWYYFIQQESSEALKSYIMGKRAHPKFGKYCIARALLDDHIMFLGVMCDNITSLIETWDLFGGSLKIEE